MATTYWMARHADDGLSWMSLSSVPHCRAQAVRSSCETYSSGPVCTSVKGQCGVRSCSQVRCCCFVRTVGREALHWSRYRAKASSFMLGRSFWHGVTPPAGCRPPDAASPW